MTISKIGAILVENLDQLAAWHFDGTVLLSRRPSTPSFWFFAAAIDGNVLRYRVLLEALSPAALSLLDLGDIAGRGAIEISDRNHWCSCDDAMFHTSDYRGPGPDACYPCAFGVHERCGYGCSWEGEIHFPETIMTRAAA